jgi:hypothetical protein
LELGFPQAEPKLITLSIGGPPSVPFQDKWLELCYMQYPENISGTVIYPMNPEGARAKMVHAAMSSKRNANGKPFISLQFLQMAETEADLAKCLNMDEGFLPKNIVDVTPPTKEQTQAVKETREALFKEAIKQHVFMDMFEVKHTFIEPKEERKSSCRRRSSSFHGVSSDGFEERLPGLCSNIESDMGNSSDSEHLRSDYEEHSRSEGSSALGRQLWSDEDSDSEGDYAPVINMSLFDQMKEMQFVPPTAVNLTISDSLNKHGSSPQAAFPQAGVPFMQMPRTCIPVLLPCAFKSNGTPVPVSGACFEMAAQIRARAQTIRQHQNETCVHLSPPPGIFHYNHVPETCSGASQEDSASTREDSGESSDGDSDVRRVTSFTSSEELRPDDSKIHTSWPTLACH